MMKVSPEVFEEIRALMQSKDHGVLSSTSVYLGGYPFGSVITYCLDRNGLPTVLISTIAQHSKNVAEDSRCSLTILSGDGPDVQANARLTISGHLRPLKDSSNIEERFYRYFAAAKTYHTAHQFEFYRLEVSMLRYIGGFGKIFWVQPEDVLLSNPFEEGIEKSMINHMNDHHKDSLIAMLQQKEPSLTIDEADLAMCGIDSEGVDVIHKGTKHRFKSPQSMTDPNSAREALVQMSQNAMKAAE